MEPIPATSLDALAGRVNQGSDKNKVGPMFREEQ